jgi:hypothetical protein
MLLAPSHLDDSGLSWSSLPHGALYAGGYRGYWVTPRPICHALSHATHRSLSACRSPIAGTMSSAPTGFTSPSENTPENRLRLPTDPKAVRRALAPPLGFWPFPLHDVSRWCPRSCMGIPLPTLRSALGVSHALDGLRHHRPCGFVSPHSRVQGFSLQGFSHQTEPHRLSPTVALVPLDSAHLRCDPGQ